MEIKDYATATREWFYKAGNEPSEEMAQRLHVEEVRENKFHKE